MQLLSVETIWVIAGVALLLVALVYWFKFEKPTRKTQKMREGLYYDQVDFRKRTVVQSFDWFTAKLNKGVLYFVVPASFSIVGPRFLLPDPYNLVISIVLCVVSLMGVLYYKQILDGAEIERNVNKPFGSSITYYPEIGDNSELWRRMENEGEIQLDATQKAVVVDQLIATAKDLPSYDSDKHNLEEMKAMWIEKLDNMHIYRKRIVDDFRILFITPHTIEESKTQGTKAVIDETVHVNVQQIPMFTIYAGTTRKVFSSTDEQDRKCFLDKTMGIYVNIYDIKSRDDDMLDGKHKVLSKENVLLAEAVHLIEQQQASAKEMTKSLRDMEKANQNYDEAEFDSTAEAHRIVQGAKGIMNALGSFTKPARTQTDALVVIVVGIVFMCVGIALGFTWGLFAGMGR